MRRQNEQDVWPTAAGDGTPAALSFIFPIVREALAMSAGQTFRFGFLNLEQPPIPFRPAENCVRPEGNWYYVYAISTWSLPAVWKSFSPMSSD